MKLKITKQLPTVQEPITIEFEVYDTALESKYLDSHDWTYFGYKTLQELEESKDNETYLSVFQQMKHAIVIVSGGRLDVLLRTPVRTLVRLSRLTYNGNDNQTVLAQLAIILKNEDEEEWEYLEEFKTVDDALTFIDRVNEYQKSVWE